MTPKEAEEQLNFELSKPKHLSPSTISRFIENRNGWFLEKVAGSKKFATAPYFQRGKAIERGIEATLRGATRETALKEAREKLFDDDLSHFTDDQHEKMAEYKEQLPLYIDAGIAAMEKYGDFVNSQQKIQWVTSACSMPIIGYLDFVFEDSVVDCKVVAKKPSGLTQGYCIQGTVYKLATGMPIRFEHLVYYSNKKGQYVESYTEDVAYQSKPTMYWHEYINMAAAAIEGVYDCIASGDVVTLLKHMSFPDLSAYFEEADKKGALSFWRKMK